MRELVICMQSGNVIRGEVEAAEWDVDAATGAVTRLSVKSIPEGEFQLHVVKISQIEAIYVLNKPTKH